MNINVMSHDELDAVALSNDERLGERMLDAIYKFLGRFVSYPTAHAQVAHTLWIAHTHAMERWDSTPRLALLSPEPASGKTRALEVTELLVPNPVSAVNVSPAYLFRKVGNEEGATILFDEIDTVFGPKAKENEEIRGLLNAGHRRGAVAGRCVVHGKTVMTEEIPAYAAVALAGLGWLPDTILSRSVIIRMRRRHAGEQVEQFRRRHQAAEGERICGMVAAWSKAVAADIVWPELPPEIQDRDADVWEPLIAVADAVGGEWPARARAAAIAVISEAKEREPSLGIRLLADLRIVFGDASEMPSKAILAALSALPESPWGDVRGKPIDERGLANRLRQYGVRPKVLRIGTQTPRGYAKADLIDAWSRYLPLPPSPGTSATSATSATSQVSQGANVADVADDPLQAQHTSPCETEDVADVADVADLAGNGGERRCAQCGGRDDGSLREHEGAWLHPECLRFWASNTDDDLDIPECLRRVS
jgi:hypothetical protein